jgi:thymidine phosphorylase
LNAAPVLPQELIRRKRDGGALSDDEIADFVHGLADGTITEGQAAAFAMAVLFRGLDDRERTALTSEMARSGRILDWSGLARPVVDKHSTGGVGDKVSLILAPLAASCGLAVPMISGRGLGHTGGTLDKLAAIPGYDTAPSVERFQRVVREVGCAIIGQTDDMAPADRRLYAIRDVTATVESIDLITASILSKKLAAGLQALVMDVKVGSGAFMADRDSARRLANTILAVAARAGLNCSALLTDMNQVLGRSAGNAVEVAEAVALLTGRAQESRLHKVTVALAAEMLVAGGLAADRAAAARQAEKALAQGRAAERFACMITSLGGPADLLENPARHLAAAPLVRAIRPLRSGHVRCIDVRRVGLAVLALGGGRTDSAAVIDPRVGLTEIAALGEPVGPDRPLALCHAGDEDSFTRCAALVQESFAIADTPPAETPILLERIAP